MENKKTKIISIVAIVALALTVITATYAYFNANIGDPAAADIKINANTVDTFTFSSGNAISFSINQDNFASGKGNITGSTYASAMLTANNKTNTATEHYYLYLNISDNSFTYSINENTPEIIMTITDSAGTEVTDISTLNHVVVTGANNTQVSGYDITNKSGLITLFDNREITTTSSKEEKWNITITFINYDSSQNANAGKSMSAKVMIQKEKIVQTVANVCKNGQTLSSCIIAMNGIDDTLYYHHSSLTNGAGDSSYRYAGGDTDYYVCNYGKNFVDSDSYTVEVNSECKKVLQATLANGNIKYYTNSSLGGIEEESRIEMIWNETTNSCYNEEEDIEFFDVYENPLPKELCKGKSYGSLGGLTSVGEGEVRKVIQNVNNFVCFGSNESSCPTDNLYRIIGVFGDQVKLVKYDYATRNLLGTDGDDSRASGMEKNSLYKGSLTLINKYYWNYKNDTTINEGNGSNDWSTSLFNKTNLNTNYLNNIGSIWANMIENTVWKVSGHTTNDVTPSAMYTAEITNATKTYGPTDGISKIGLMYVSDYGFAADPSAWATSLSSYNMTTNLSSNISLPIPLVNWMYMAEREWTMTPISSTSYNVFTLYSNGYLDGVVNDSETYNANGARPVLYLKASVAYAGGSGTKDAPITLVV